MPVDAEPVTVDGHAEPKALLYWTNGARVAVDAWGWLYGYRPHWPTCPNRDSFRKIGGGHDTPYRGGESHEVVTGSKEHA